MGDDYNSFWPGVVKAVNEFVAVDPRRKLKLRGNTWVIHNVVMHTPVRAVSRHTLERPV